MIAVIDVNQLIDEIDAATAAAAAATHVDDPGELLDLVTPMAAFLQACEQRGFLLGKATTSVSQWNLPRLKTLLSSG